MSNHGATVTSGGIARKPAFKGCDSPVSPLALASMSVSASSNERIVSSSSSHHCVLMVPTPSPEGPRQSQPLVTELCKLTPSVSSSMDSVSSSITERDEAAGGSAHESRLGSMPWGAGYVDGQVSNGHSLAGRMRLKVFGLVGRRSHSQ